MRRARWKPGSQFRSRLSAATAGKALRAIAKTSGGVLAPETIVAAARSRSSPLHGLFEWDDRAAAEQHRLATARLIVRSLEIPDGEDYVREYAHVRVRMADDEAAPVYVPMLHAMKVPDWRAQVLDQALAELEGWTFRYRKYREMADAVEDVKRVVNRHRKPSGKRRPRAKK